MFKYNQLKLIIFIHFKIKPFNTIIIQPSTFLATEDNFYISF